MIRLIFYVAILILTGGFAFWLALHPGEVMIHAFGFEIRTSAAAAIVFLLLATFALTLLWRSLGWLIELPGRLRKARAEARRAKGYDALENAVIAAASGDAMGAVKNAERVKALLDRPALSGLLAARAAEAAGDTAGAERHYKALLNDKRTSLAARRGLVRAALERHDYDTAISEAMAAFDAAPAAKWAFEALFDAQIAARDWAGAAVTLSRGQKRGHIVPLAAKRRRAVLLAAQSAEAEAQDELDAARQLAEKAVAAAPGFAPAAAQASRLLVQAGKSWRAAGLLEEAWASKPHPALALAYRDLKENEKPRARAKRLRGLAHLNPEHRESRILLAEVALEEHDPKAARAALAPVMEAEQPPSSRLCTLMSQIERAAGNKDEATAWLHRAMSAPSEPDWSDLDPEGPAFGYRDEDWARLVYSFGDAGELIHPRHERFERVPLDPGQVLFLEAPEEPEEPKAPETPESPEQESPEQETGPDQDGAEQSDSDAEVPPQAAPAKSRAKAPRKILPKRKRRTAKKTAQAKTANTPAAPKTAAKADPPASPDMDVAGFPRQPDDPGPLVEDEAEAASPLSRKRKVH